MKSLLWLILMTTNYDPEVFLYDHFHQSLKQTGLTNELIDPREANYIFNHVQGAWNPRNDFYNDCRVLWRRHIDLIDAPPLSDSERFPDRNFLSEACSFNRSYRYRVETWPAWHEDEIRDVLEETDRLYSIFDLARDAQCEYYYLTVRRAALKNLRTKIGYEDYYKAKLPPVVPTWRCIPIP